jgi:glyoxylase-like metal-dependent hydrolase (beta-lactamase superfamily II)
MHPEISLINLQRSNKQVAGSLKGDGMRLHQMTLGELASNCIFLTCEKTNSTVVIDPGAEEDRIKRYIKEQGFESVTLLHTHGHLDHCGATGVLKRENIGDIYMHADDDGLFQGLGEQARMFGFNLPMPEPVDVFLEHGKTITIGEEIKIKVLHTPGHTQGSCCFYLEDESLLISGDTLFNGSVGRTDLPGGCFEQLLSSISQNLMSLPEKTRVICGHGGETTIGQEKRFNPFLQQGTFL